MSAEAWSELKRSYRTSGLMMACGQPGVPKTSRLGTQFFAHASGADCQLHEGGPESPEHLATKAAVARAAREISWDAVIEYPAPDRTWIADVLVSNGNRRIAVEAQWSSQMKADFERRQRRYETAGIECFWLAAPANTENARTVPHYETHGTVDDLQIQLPTFVDPTTRPLGDGIKMILRQQVLPVAEFIATHASIRTQMSKCWHCEKWMSLWAVTGLDLESRCGGMVTIGWPDPWELWAAERHERRLEPLIREAIQGSDLPTAVELRMKRSDQAERTYLAMTCPSCGYVQGDGMLDWRPTAPHYAIPLGNGIRLPFAPRVRARPHVCLDIGRGQCEQDLPDPRAVPARQLFPPASEYLITRPRRIDLPALPPPGSRRGAR